MIRVLHISDTHLSAEDQGALTGWHAVVRYIRDTRPDLVIHTGDIVRNDPFDAEDRNFAARELAGLGVEILAIPGNHDIGDGPPNHMAPDAGLIALFCEAYGGDHWVRQINDWYLIGVNALLFGIGGDREAAHWAWLEDALSAGRRGAQLAVFVHKPPFLLTPDEALSSSAVMPLASRARFWDLIRRSGVKLVACEHRHEYRALQRDGIQVVWGPTTSNRLDERSAPLVPLCLPGVVEHAFVGSTAMHRVVPLAL